MVTASHNPHYDNGLKILSYEGGKLTSVEEQSIECHLSKTDHAQTLIQLSLDNSSFKEVYIKISQNGLSLTF